MPLTSSSSSFSGPVAPNFIEEGGKTAAELKTSAQTSAQAQLARLQDYINHLYRVRELSKMAAKGAAARSGGQQNPLAVYRGMTELARQAAIPIDAEIAKVLQGSNNIENTMNQLINQAGSLQAQLGSIMQSGSNSATWSDVIGGGRGRGRGPGQGGGQDQGNFVNIRGQRGGPEVMDQGELGRDAYSRTAGVPGTGNANVERGFQNPANLEYLERTGAITPQQQNQLNSWRMNQGQMSQYPSSIGPQPAPQFAQYDSPIGPMPQFSESQSRGWDDIFSSLPGFSNFGSVNPPSSNNLSEPSSGGHTNFALEEAPSASFTIPDWMKPGRQMAAVNIYDPYNEYTPRPVERGHSGVGEFPNNMSSVWSSGNYFEPKKEFTEALNFFGL